MGKVFLLDCTLRDGGYINDWCFGKEAILGIVEGLSETGVDMVEIGFIKGTSYDPNRSVFPDVKSFRNVIRSKDPSMLYVGMLDMSAPVDLSAITPKGAEDIDGIRVIFKKNKTDEAYAYCKHIKEMGYDLYVNFVGTDQYTDDEFIAGLKRFTELSPEGMTIVDTFGVIKRKQFLHMVKLADQILPQEIKLCYHAHNNLQQAFGNAEAMVEMDLSRDLVIDACIFGMGRGAGNLNLELFAEFMNENYGTNYKIEPMLRLMDLYLSDFYKTRFWGYSLPLYLSATLNCHPNYAIYLAEKDSLPVALFHEILASISDEDKREFSKEKAESYYRRYMDHPIDDTTARNALSQELSGFTVLLLAPGISLSEQKEKIAALAEKPDTKVIAVNFAGGDFTPDLVFSSNMRRYARLQDKVGTKSIVTSNMRDVKSSKYVVDFASYASEDPRIRDNSGVMLLKLLSALGVKKVWVAGMDGYTSTQSHNYFDAELEYDFSSEYAERNRLISEEISKVRESMEVTWITPTHYTL
ncbi:MAG: hypothetical protein J6Y08_05860 [Clostridiales bacterium]|nr:hypothetical protein [Clostridiales bacterium]